MRSILNWLVPERLGRNFRWLLASSWTSNIGDGIALAAGPLLVATQTGSPMLVALAAILQRVPWLIFGLWAGALADRLDRRRQVMIANGLRAVVVAALCVTIATGRVSIVVVLTTMLLYGIAEVFADSASSTLLPMMVKREDLGIGNHRQQAGFLTCEQLIGPPVGAFLFAAGWLWPFAIQVVCVSLAVLLIARISVTRTAPVTAQSHLRRDIVEGLRWVWHNAPIRTLALTILVFNITWAAPWAVLVLWARDHLGLTEVEYGLLITAAAIGGLVGTSLYGWIERHVRLATLMRVCLLLEVLTHFALALTTNGWVAIAIMVEFGAYAFVWGTVSGAVRQRAVPEQFQGRVGAVYRICVFGGLFIGQVLGGIIAQNWGVVAPFWFAGVGAGITLLLVWRQLAHIAHLGDATDPAR